MKPGALFERFYGGNYKRFILLPAALFFVFAFLAFVSPGIEQGIDLKGGTLIVIGTTSLPDAAPVAKALEENFELTDLQVIPFQGGIQVQYGSSPLMQNARENLELARGLEKTSPERSLELCEETIESLSSLTAPEKASFDSAGECLAFSQGFFDDASREFDERIQSAITGAIGEENVKKDSARKTEISPSLGKFFWAHAQSILLIALVAVIVVIFIFFRAVVPSIAVLLAASFDILAALGLMAVFGVSFSLASISSLLMLVGYSVDTDIMLTTRLTKRKFRTPRQNAADSMVTGLTMTGTTLGAVVVMLALSAFWNLEVIFSIAAVLLFGLIGDLISTWFMNAPILMWYVEKRKKGAS